MTLLLAAAGGVTAFNVGFVLGAAWGGMWRKASMRLDLHEQRVNDHVNDV